MAAVTLYATLFVSSYLLVILASTAQFIALAWFTASHIPGGITGMQLMSGLVWRGAMGAMMGGGGGGGAAPAA